MPAVWRIRDRRTFADLRRSGLRVRSGPIAVIWLPGPQGTPPRVAYAVGRPVGTAVERNRLRRRLRAVVAGLADGLAPGAYLLAAGPEAAALDPEEMTTTVSTALAALAHRSRP
jgi:ribonuclease P protein component